LDSITKGVGAVENLEKKILLAEDNPDDTFIFKRALKAANIVNPLVVVTDGQEAVNYLSHTGEYSDQTKYPSPFLVFLDLKMPYLDGFEVLTWIRKQPLLQSVVVVMLSGSNETIDQQRCYSLGARSYLVKPPRPEELRQFMDSMSSYGAWPQGV
jgi:CheY-like chemotaxis protein